MEIIKNTVSLVDRHPLILDSFTEDTILFDIETTGFSPRTTELYLIGIASRAGASATITQLLAESPSDQEAVLTEFLSLLEGHKTLLTYNGIGFDIPYLKEKLQEFSLPDPFERFAFLDLFKEVQRLRTVLSLSDCKQKTVECFLSIEREDKYSGGDLIPIYRHFLATKDPLPRELLLRHNLEDVTGMLELMKILSYPEFFRGGFTVEETETTLFPEAKGNRDGELNVLLRPSHEFPKRITAAAGDYFLIAEGNAATLSIAIIKQELKYFFPDPENYYYLPEEDLAIHKSVSAYVDKTHRKKATKSNCYIRKSAYFLPQGKEFYTPAFRADYSSKELYFELPEVFDTEGNDFHSYLMSCLECFLKGSHK